MLSSVLLATLTQVELSKMWSGSEMGSRYVGGVEKLGPEEEICELPDRDRERKSQIENEEGPLQCSHRVNPVT